MPRKPNLATPAPLVVTEGDRILCPACYRDGLSEHDVFTHRYGTVKAGTCDSCGETTPASRDVIAVDFETYYATPKKAEKLGITPCSVSELGIMAYMAHPDFEAYLVAIVGPNIRYVGHPDEFDWSKLHGKHLIAHNAGFDQPIADGFLAKAGAKAAKWDCTADLAAFHGYPRSLSGAMKELFGQFVSKQVRNDMDGVRWETLPDFKKAEVIRYADSDSVNCLRIWEKISPTWPEHEREISRLNRLMGHRGLHLDTDLCCRFHQTLNARLDELEKPEIIPWAGGLDEDGDEVKLGSRKAFNAACAAAGVPVPTTKAKKAQAWLDWLEEHGKKAKFAVALAEHVSVNRMAKLCEVLLSRYLTTGRFSYDKLYFGAATGRFSGAGGFNMENLNSRPVAGVAIRNVFDAPPGRTLAVCDYSQVEPRCSAYLSGDTEFLEACRTGLSAYLAHGISTGRVRPEAVPAFEKARDVIGSPEYLTYAGLKAELLLLGYGGGGATFARSAGVYGIDVSEDEAKLIVSAFRKGKPKLTARWRWLEDHVRAQILQGARSPTITLPSGRKLTYHKAHMISDQEGFPPRIRAMGTLGKGAFSDYYAGKFHENECQAMARDVMCDAAPKIESAIAQYDAFLVLTVHDELVAECPVENAQIVLDTMRKIMSMPPNWAPTLPLKASGKIMTRYSK